MAFFKVNNVSIKGISAAVPKNIVYTKDYELFDELECKKFEDSVGVLQRRVANENTCTSDLCFAAAEKIIQDLKWDKNEIDVLIFVSHTADYKLPATSCILQDRLGLKTGCMTLDISLGCSGYTHGLHVISSILQSGGVKKALLLVGNTQSKYASYFDKSVYPLFADAGSATALEYCEIATPMYFSFGTDGSSYESIIVRDGGCRNPVTLESFDLKETSNGNRLSNLHEFMDGMEVFSFGINRIPKEINKFLDNFSIDNIDYALFHQANKLMINKIAKKLNISNEKVPLNIDRFGNTSCTTIPLLIATEMQNIFKGNNSQRCLLSGFGVGLSWGNCFVELNNIIISDLVEI